MRTDLREEEEKAAERMANSLAYARGAPMQAGGLMTI